MHCETDNLCQTIRISELGRCRAAGDGQNRYVAPVGMNRSSEVIVTRLPPRQAGLLAVALVAAACGAGDRAAPSRWGGSVDTLASGRIVVRSPDVPAWDDTWILEERFRVGALEGDGHDLFGHIGGLEIGPTGELYVLDDQANELRIFGSDGSFQRAIGREGQGPGELRSPGGLALDSGGTLWLLNWGNGRYTGFDPVTGDVRREARRLVSFATFPWPGAFEKGAHLLDVGLNADGQPSILRLDTAFVPSDTLPLPAPAPDDRITFHRGAVMIASMMEPFAPQPSWTPRPRGGVILGEGSAYRLHRIGFDGDTSMTMELEREPARVSQAERDSALAFFHEMAGSLDGATPDRQPRARGKKPAHGSLLVDDQDRTWVRSVPPAGRAPTWDVFAPDGRFLGQVDILDPVGFLRPAIRGGRMAVATLADGFPVVVVYDLVRDRR